MIDLPQHLLPRLQAELKAGESLVWAGQPIPGRLMRSAFKLWYFFVPWTAFSVYWIMGASGFEMPRFDDGESLFPLFGLPFLLIGLGGMGAPFWVRRQAHSTIYAITTRRAITIEGVKTIKVKSYPVDSLCETERTEHPDGSGDLVLRKESYRDSDGDQQIRSQGFFAIEQVRGVEQLIEKMMLANKA